MLGFFITGTDTEVGKTEVACALAHHHQSIVRKPIETGCELINGELFAADAYKLQQAGLPQQTLAQICKFRFAEAIAPEAAMVKHQQNITVDDLVLAIENPEFTIVEGAGGWLSPLAINTSNADLAVVLNLPIILVVANRLGCINHTLLTLAAIKSVDLQVAKIYLTYQQANEIDYFYDLNRWLKLPINRLKFSHNPEPWRSFTKSI